MQARASLCHMKPEDWLAMIRPFTEALRRLQCVDLGALPIFEAGGVVRRVRGVPRAHVHHNSIVRLLRSLYDPLSPQPA